MSGALNWCFFNSFIFFLYLFFPPLSAAAFSFSLVCRVLLASGPMGCVSLCGPNSRSTWKSAFCPTLNPAPMRLSWPVNENTKEGKVTHQYIERLYWLVRYSPPSPPPPPILQPGHHFCYFENRHIFTRKCLCGNGSMFMYQAC